MGAVHLEHVAQGPSPVRRRRTSARRRRRPRPASGDRLRVRQDAPGLIYPEIGRYTSPEPLHMSAAMSFAGPQVYSYAAARPLVYVDPDGRNLSPMQDCSTIGPVTICSPTSGVLGGEAAPFGTGLARSSAAALARRIGGTAWLGGKFLCWLTDCESIPPPGEKPPPDDDGMCVEDSGGGRPGWNQPQNLQFRDALQECERQLGRDLSADERQALHREIQHLEDPGYWDILDLCLELFG